MLTLPSDWLTMSNKDTILTHLTLLYLKLTLSNLFAVNVEFDDIIWQQFSLICSCMRLRFALSLKSILYASLRFFIHELQQHKK